MHTSIFDPDRYEFDPQDSLRPSKHTVNCDGVSDHEGVTQSKSYGTSIVVSLGYERYG